MTKKSNQHILEAHTHIYTKDTKDESMIICSELSIDSKPKKSTKMSHLQATSQND